MMNEQKRKQVENLTDEERVKRMREGGEDMNAELAMEEAEKAKKVRGGGEDMNAELAMEEAERRTLNEKIKGQKGNFGQAERDQMAKEGSDNVAFQAGTGSYYSDSWEKPVGNASPASSFGEGSPSSRPPRGREAGNFGQAERDQDGKGRLR